MTECKVFLGIALLVVFLKIIVTEEWYIRVTDEIFPYCFFDNNQNQNKTIDYLTKHYMTSNVSKICRTNTYPLGIVYNSKILKSQILDKDPWIIWHNMDYNRKGYHFCFIHLFNNILNDQITHHYYLDDLYGFNISQFVNNVTKYRYDEESKYNTKRNISILTTFIAIICLCSNSMLYVYICFVVIIFIYKQHIFEFSLNFIPWIFWRIRQQFMKYIEYIILKDCLECIQMFDKQIKSHYVGILNNKFKNVSQLLLHQEYKIKYLQRIGLLYRFNFIVWNVLLYAVQLLNTTRIDLLYNIVMTEIIVETTLFIMNPDIINQLGYESAVCLLHFSKKYMLQLQQDNMSKNKLNNIEITANKTDDEIYHIWIKCMCVILSAFNDEHLLKQRLLKHGIIQKLGKFCDLCRTNEFLLDLTELYDYLCDSDDMLQDNGINNIILLELHNLLMYEDDDMVLSNVLNVYIKLLNKTNINIERITEDGYSNILKQRYILKQGRNEIIFNGFIRENIFKSNIPYLPNDIVLLIVNYFNCYKHFEMDFIQRLICIISKGNGYSLNVRNAALETIHDILYFCDDNFTNKLLKKYKLIHQFRLLLEDRTHQKEYLRFDFIYNSLSYIYGDIGECFWSSNIMKVMIDTLIYVISYNLQIASKILNQLTEIIQGLYEDEVTLLITKYELIKVLLIIIDKVIHYDVVDDDEVDVIEILNTSLDILELGLQNEYNKDICIKKILQHNGLELLQQIYESKNITLCWRAQDILIDYFHFDESL